MDYLTKYNKDRGNLHFLHFLEKMGFLARGQRLLKIWWGWGQKSESSSADVEFQHFYDHLQCIKSLLNSNAHTIYIFNHVWGSYKHNKKKKIF